LVALHFKIPTTKHKHDREGKAVLLQRLQVAMHLVLVD
jgi:hypothetical protein